MPEADFRSFEVRARANERAPWSSFGRYADVGTATTEATRLRPRTFARGVFRDGELVVYERNAPAWGGQDD